MQINLLGLLLLELSILPGSLSEPLFFAEARMEFPLLCQIAGGEACIFSNRAPTKKSVNEDAAALVPIGQDSGLLIVADGVGGSRRGNQAALIAVETISHAVTRRRENKEQLRSAILDGIELANRRILELGIGASTTLALLEINRDEIRPYHIGDSLILSVGSKGKIKLNPTEHSPTGYGVIAGLLNQEEAIYHDSRHLVSNVVGDAAMHIEIGPTITVSSRDTVLIASDGVSDNLRSEEIIEIIRKGTLFEVGQNLLRLAQHRMLESASGEPSKPDDLTFIVYRKL